MSAHPFCGLIFHQIQSTQKQLTYTNRSKCYETTCTANSNKKNDRSRLQLLMNNVYSRFKYTDARNAPSQQLHVHTNYL